MYEGEGYKEEEEQNELDLLQSVIANAPANIELEYARDASNPWLACVNSQLQIIMNHLDFATEDGAIDTESAEQASVKLYTLVGHIKELFKTYPKRSDMIPDDIKEKIFSQLNILA